MHGMILEPTGNWTNVARTGLAGGRAPLALHPPYPYSSHPWLPCPVLPAGSSPTPTAHNFLS
eukprot:scaffold8270_cov124-Isochrysis_galbana.AAC.2